MITAEEARKITKDRSIIVNLLEKQIIEKAEKGINKFHTDLKLDIHHIEILEKLGYKVTKAEMYIGGPLFCIEW